jgi:hypothetical protein
MSNAAIWYEVIDNFDIITDSKFYNVLTPDTQNIKDAFSSGGKRIKSVSGEAPNILGFEKPKGNKIYGTPYETLKNISLENCSKNCIEDQNCKTIEVELPNNNLNINSVSCSKYNSADNYTDSRGKIYRNWKYQGFSNDKTKTILKDYELLLISNRPTTICDGKLNKINKGKVNADKCKNECLIDPSCVSFDISNSDKRGNFDCNIYTGDSNNLKAKFDKNSDGCYKKTTPTKQLSKRMYTKNNWGIFKGKSGIQNTNWNSGSYILTNDINYAAQVTKSSNENDNGYNIAPNNNDLVSIIIDIGNWNFDSIDIYIKFAYNYSNVKLIPPILPFMLSKYKIDKEGDKSILNGTDGILNNFPIVSIGTHDIWTSPPTDFNLSTKLPPYNIGLAYVNCHNINDALKFKDQNGNIKDGMYPLSIIKKHIKSNYNLTTTIYSELPAEPGRSRIFKLTIDNKNIADKKRYIVISHFKTLKSSLIDVIFN